MLYFLKRVIFDEFHFQIQKPHRMDHEQKREKADNIVLNHVGFAASAAFLPFPVADIAAVSAVQVIMAKQTSMAQLIVSCPSCARGATAQSQERAPAEKAART